VVLWSVLFLKERMDKQRAGALLLALLGCVLTVDPFSLVGASAAKFSFEGVFLALGSALSYSFYILLAGRFGKGVPGLVAAAYSVPATALIYIGWCILSGQFQWGMSGLGWLYCLVIGVGAALAIGCYQTGIQLIGPVRASITATTEPATAVLLGIIILNENANLVKLVGGSLILGAVLLLSRPRKEQAR
jgi:drug/metabolite transporter (DMT)-like permease